MNGYDLASYFLNKFGDEGVEKMLRCTRGAETDWLEFKASLQFDPELEENREEARARKGERQNDLYWNVAKALVSLHNTRGGALVVGIDDRSALRDAVGVPDGDFDRFIREEIGQGLLRDKRKYTTGRGGAVSHVLTRQIEVEPHPASFCGKTVAVLLVRPAKDGNLLSTTETRNNQDSVFFYHRWLGRVGEVLKASSDESFERGLGNRDLDGIKAAFEAGNEAFFGPDPLPSGRRFLRLRVDGRDGDTAFCFEDGAADTLGPTFRVDLARCNLSSGVRDAIREGDVLSLVHPGSNPDTGNLSSRFLVWNPDITLSPEKLGRASIYANPGVKYWLDVFSPGIPVERANQGNFANQCLADSIANPDAIWRDSARNTFQENPSSVVLGYPDDFDQAAIFANMKRFVRMDILNRARRDIPPESWRTEVPLVEPDFGLSAKADAVSISDPEKQAASVSLEIKSGKWDRFRGDRPKPEHVFQPAVYGAALAARSDGPEPVRSLLFYPKPDSGNQYNAPAPFGFCHPSPGDLLDSIVVKCVNIRNEVLLFERKMEDGVSLGKLASLAVDDFRKDLDPRNISHWNRYFRSGVERQLIPFHADDPLALEWCRQFLAFAATEDRLAREGTPDGGDERACQADAWRLPLETRIKRGMCLELLFPPERDSKDDLGRIVGFEVSLVDHGERDGDSDSVACSIRTGDSVYLYPDRGPESGIAKSLPFAAVVESLDSGRATFRLEEPVSETAAGFGAERRWIAEGRNDRGQDLLFQGAAALLGGVPQRRDILLGRINPGFEPNAVVPAVVTDSPRVWEILGNAWRAKDYFLVWGPPGTGKTHSMIRALVEAALAADGDGKILLLSYTNRASDELCDMLEELKKRLPDLDWWRIGNAGKCSVRHRGHLPSCRTYNSEDAVRNEFDGIRIFVGTVSSLGPDNPVFRLGENASFKLAVVDEASQLLEPQVAPLFCARKREGIDEPLIWKFVFVGDDRQLPAVVQQSSETSKVATGSPLLEKSIQLENRRDSLFERLHRFWPAGSHRCGLLDEQHRMPPVLSAFVSESFYDGGKLKDSPEAKKKKPTLPVPEACSDWFDRFVLKNRLGFVPVPVGDGSADRDSKSNKAEADYCARIVATLLDWKQVETPDQIGIVVPFRKQIDRIREALRAWNVPGKTVSGILIDTVERFQGSQRDIILYSTVVGSAGAARLIQDEKRFKYSADGTSLGLCTVDRKLNVAITRAKERFFLIGDETALSGMSAYKAFVDYIREKGAVYGE